MQEDMREVNRMADRESLTCSILEFAHIAGIKDTQARSICAGLYPPPLIVVGRETRVIRSHIPEWLDSEAARQMNGRPGAEVLGDVATGSGDRALLQAL